jgi:hypothetical protein
MSRRLLLALLVPVCEFRVGFVPRDAIAAAIRHDTDGRFSLDPPGGGR